jgi:hypothetical protein
VAGLLLDQVEQDPLKGRRPGCVPPVTRLADVSKVMGFHDGPAACRLSVQRRHKLFERLAGGNRPPNRNIRSYPPSTLGCRGQLSRISRRRTSANSP